jgi:hypothetical protein
VIQKRRDFESHTHTVHMSLLHALSIPSPTDQKLTAAFLLGQGKLRFSTLRLGLILPSKMSYIIISYSCSPPGDRHVHNGNDRAYLHMLSYVKFHGLPG